MTLRLTLDVFSGRPNPQVEVSDEEANELLERLSPGRVLREEKGEMPRPTLGYRGIVFEQTETVRDDLPQAFRLAGGSVVGKGLSHRTRDPEIEKLLTSEEGPFRKVETEKEFFPRVAELREQSIEIWRREWEWEWELPPIIVFPWPRPCPCGPLYEPGWWNQPPRQFSNNCYNYGCNYRTDTFAQPGKASGAQYNALQCGPVLAGAIADDLVDTPNADNQCPPEGHLVALVVAPGWDFHWYRKDRTGWWSHKPGGTQATNLDNSGHQIFDPRNADRGLYTDFCTFMIARHGHIKIR